MAMRCDAKTLIRRHSEFVTLYNAETTSIKPKSMLQIKHELAKTESAISTRASHSVLPIHIPPDKVEECLSEYSKNTRLDV